MGRYLFLISMCALLVALGHAAIENEEATSIFAQGINALKSGQLDAALEAFARVTILRPDFADAHYHLGLVYYEKAEFRKAMEAFTRTLERLPRDVDAWIKLGLASHKADDYERAVAAYQTALDIRPHNVEALNNQGLAYQAQGRFDAAIAAYEEGLTLHPHQPQLHANLATTRDLQAGIYSLTAYRHHQVGARAKRAGNIAAARAAWQQAIAESPKYLQAYLQLADLYFKNGAYASAIQTYLSAMALISEGDVSEPAGTADIFYNLGNCYLSTQQLESAVSAYQHAIDIHPEMVSAWANMGIALLEMERFDSAIAACQSALKAHTTVLSFGKNPGVSSAELRGIGFTLQTAQDIKAREYTMQAYRLWKQGLSAANRGDTPTALKLWEGAVELSPRYTTAHENLMWAYFNRKQFDAAIQAGKTVQTLRPNPQVTQVIAFASELKAGKYPFKAYQLWEQGRRASAAGNLETAVALLSKAIATGPEFAAAYNTLAWLYADTQGTQLAEAERLARRAHELDPDATHIYDTLGWILYKQERYAEALDVFERVLGRAPNNPEYLYHGSLAALKTGQSAQALAYLTQAIGLDKRILQRIHTQSEFDAIRFTPAFRALIP